MLSKSNKLYAGPWVGEFGWELFCWQGYLRQLSKSFKHTTVACRKGHECLYEDFAETASVDCIPCESNMWDCKGYKRPLFQSLFKCQQGTSKWLQPMIPVVRYDHTHQLDKTLLFREFPKQAFVQYGIKSKGYDVLIHARSKSNLVNNGIKSSYRNWDKENWINLTNELQGKTIACIGTTQESEYIAGDDLRGISLKSLSDVFASSKLLISPSSGPVHFASLCGCPQVTWYGNPYDSQNTNRFITDWNPFNVKSSVIYNEKWNPDINQVLTLAKPFLD